MFPMFGRIAAGVRLDSIPARIARAMAYAVMAGFAVGVMYFFHGRFWWPPDDGAYAHVAARILNGDVLNRDVQDIHAGYINFANALWLWLFGPDLVSLRYPLAVMAVVQSCILFRMLLPMGLSPAFAGSIAMTSLSVVQFLNPTAHWYALFIFVLIVWALASMDKEARGRLEAIGFLVATLLLFRQLSGVLVAMGVVAYLLSEAPGRRPGPRGPGGPWLSRSLALFMAAGLLGYLTAQTGVLALILFGIGPLGALVWTASIASLTTGETVRLIARLALGAAVALAPLIAYHAAHGSLLNWLDDTVWSALHLTALEFMTTPSYAILAWLGAAQIFSPQSLATLLNGLFWVVLPLLPMALGVTLVLGLFRSSGRNTVTHHPLPFLAAFYAIVSAHYQIPIYLFYSTAVAIAGLLVLFGARATWRGHSMAGLAVLLSGIGLWYQAGQPVSRGMLGIVAGDRVSLVQAEAVPHASIWMTADDARTYRDVIALIEREVPKDAPILALPFDPELYFLSDRRNPTRFFNSGFGIRDERELDSTIQVLRQDPPVLVFHRSDDKYNTRLSDRLMGFVQSHYETLPQIGGLAIYRYRPR
jgi:hypothetical protein